MYEPRSLPPGYRIIHASENQADMEAVQLINFQQETEQTLAEAGAELSMFLHTKYQKSTFDEALKNHLAVMGNVAKNQVTELVESGATENQVCAGAVSMLVDSKASVLRRDHDYRLANSWLERRKERIAEKKVARLAGPTVSSLITGGLAYFAFKGIENPANEHNSWVIASALGAHTGFRALGQKLKEFSSRQFDEHILLKDITQQESDEQNPAKQLKRHIDHVSATEGELYKIASQHFAEAPGQYNELTPKLIDGLKRWYEDYYRQPTLKDRAETLAIGSFTLSCTAVTIAAG